MIRLVFTDGSVQELDSLGAVLLVKMAPGVDGGGSLVSRQREFQLSADHIARIELVASPLGEPGTPPSRRSASSTWTCPAGSLRRSS